MVKQMDFLTSVKHSPGVVMRNPSSPWKTSALHFKISVDGVVHTSKVYARTVASGPR